MNRQLRITIITLLLLVSVGFAAVATNLLINGSATIGINENDMQVLFTKVETDNADAFISLDGKSIEFITYYLENIGDQSSLTYTVTNNSSNYDANVEVKLTDDLGNEISSDLFTVEETQQLPNLIEAKTNASGILKITLTKGALEDTKYKFHLTITSSPVERTAKAVGDDITLPTDPGLYNQNNELVSTWDDLINKYSLSLTKDYSGWDDPDERRLRNIINVIDPDNANLYKLIIDDSVDKIGEYALSSVQGLTTVVFSKNITTIGANAFNMADELTELIIPEGVTSIGEYAFSNSDRLQYIWIPKTVDGFDETWFNSVNSLTSIEIEEGHPMVKSIDGVVYSADGKNLIYYPEGRMNTTYVIQSDVIGIGEYAFEDVKYLTDVIFEGNNDWLVNDEITITAAELSDHKRAAQLLINEYYSDYWSRIENFSE